MSVHLSIKEGNSVKKRKRISLLLVLALLLTVLSACSSKSNDAGSSGSPTTSSANPETGADGQNGEAAAGKNENAASDGPFSKYETPITMKSTLATQGWATFPAGETWDNDNIWHKLIRETLGIDVKWAWQVDGAQYFNKVNLTISSNDLPDVMMVNKQQLNQLVEADMVEDMTQAFDQYAMPFLKEQVKSSLLSAQKTALYNGKLMAIPQYAGDPRDSALTLYIRTDWLANVGLPEPKTLDELVQTADAFAKKDPDGDKKSDTYGLGLLPLYTGGGSLTGFLNGYHAYPAIWVPDSSGKLAYSSTLPEMKTALGRLQQMYKDGLLDKEFGTKDFNRLKEDVIAEKVGMFYATTSESATILGEAMKKNPKALWKALPLVSIDGQPARPSVPITGGAFFVVKKGYTHPEAVLKIMNLFVTKVYGEDGAGKGADSNYAWKDNGKYAVFPQSPIQAYVKDFNYVAVRDALKNNDGSQLPENLKKTYDLVKSTDGTEVNEGKWQQWWIYQTNVSPFEVRANYQKDPNFTIVDSFYGGSTKTMEEKMSTLFTMELETFVKIIMNAAPLDDFDKFVANWSKLGGEQITKEVNEWYVKNK
ncbi:lipoprotein LipO [Paenibacillus baekrokdamisoli]|uniref:Lipoprotein LipO n=1 Tax=Paenibacillus baekrokdamisoli TaxID=1712516 RepID=A0A3G9IYL9_9BACL|nr:lipoprotein LipO [Paenibacillus baekrokdamisoli]